jgi:Cu2+-exporting ATPase
VRRPAWRRHAARHRALGRVRQARLSGLIDAVRKAGYDAVPDAAAPARAMRRRDHRQALWRLFVASFCAMQVMMMATPSYVARPKANWRADMRQLLNWGGWVLSAAGDVVCRRPVLPRCLANLRARRIGMDVPVALALLVTFVASMGATFDPAGRSGTRCTSTR